MKKPKIKPDAVTAMQNLHRRIERVRKRTPAIDGKTRYVLTLVLNEILNYKRELLQMEFVSEQRDRDLERPEIPEKKKSELDELFS